MPMCFCGLNRSGMVVPEPILLCFLSIYTGVESNIALPPEIMVESGSTVGFPSAASSGVLVTWFWRSIIQDRVVPGETFIGGNLVSRMSWLLRSNSQNFYAVGQQSLQHNISTSTQVVRKSNVAGHPVTEATTDVIVLSKSKHSQYFEVRDVK